MTQQQQDAITAATTKLAADHNAFMALEAPCQKADDDWNAARTFAYQTLPQQIIQMQTEAAEKEQQTRDARSQLFAERQQLQVQVSQDQIDLQNAVTASLQTGASEMVGSNAGHSKGF